MSTIIISMHMSLDGFVAGKNGEMDWISLSDDMFDYVAHLTDNADTVLYGRKTFEMMDAYWVRAGDKANASKHDIEHSAWYNKTPKYVLSNSMKGQDRENLHIIGAELSTEIAAMKQQSKNSIIIFGSPTAIHSLLAENLIDEFYLFVNPVLLGEGIPLFKNIQHKTVLQLQSSRSFNDAGVVCVHYTRA